MNGSMIRYVLGWVLKIEAALMLLPMLTALVYREAAGFVYMGVAGLALFFGVLMSWKKPASNIFYLKEGCVITALSWIFLSLFGALPFTVTGEIPNYIDALFEVISGFTTTGASILNGAQVDALSRCSLFWRSFTHWIGGMGVLVFLLAIVPLSGGSHINLMRAESPGPSVGKLVPKLRTTALLLYGIYFGLTVLEIVLLICGRMPVFDALLVAFGTAGTGGFWINSSSMGDLSYYLQWVIAVFMILFGVNFNFYYYLLFRKAGRAFGMEEVRGYFLIILSAVAVIFFNIRHMVGNAFTALTQSVFQVGSVITTTGFSTTDFDTWPALSKIILVMLMFCGACAGSTGGGIKVSRLIIAAKSVLKELRSYIHPKSVHKIKVEGKPVEHDVVRAVNVYLITFIMIFSLSLLLISFDSYVTNRDEDLVTGFTAVAATINNIGPGLAGVGPTKNFGSFNAFSKLVLSADMLAGRLELFPLLILLHPGAWHDVFHRRRKKFV